MTITPIEIIKNRRDFLACAATGHKFVRPTLVMQIRERSPEDAVFVKPELVRVGFTCTKTLGNAVVRNRIKRRLRAAAAEIFAKTGKAGYDYVMIGRGKAQNCPYPEIVSDMEMAAARLNRVLSEKKKPE